MIKAVAVRTRFLSRASFEMTEYPTPSFRRANQIVIITPIINARRNLFNRASASQHEISLRASFEMTDVFTPYSPFPIPYCLLNLASQHLQRWPVQHTSAVK